MDLAIAAAAGLYEAGAAHQARPGRSRPVAVVGRDPRVSGEFLESAVVAGLAGAGVDVLRLGVIPTPAVAYLTAALEADLGVMLSASHNPAPDNGIKLFGRGGFKLPDAAEDEIEARLADPGNRPSGPPRHGFGRVRDAHEEGERYLSHLLGSLPRPERLIPPSRAAVPPSRRPVPPSRKIPPSGKIPSGKIPPSGKIAPLDSDSLPLAGMRVVVDCANGAASELAPLLLSRAGAEVIAIGADPDGENINAGCGSTHLETLSTAVVEHAAAAGIAHDGDADRCLAVDAAGRVIDGDQILAVLALELQRRGQLAKNTVVATVMSNLGFRLAMKRARISVVETAVGDRYVLEAMRKGGVVLGGEQSGHIIMLDHATTGDGLLTALHLLAAVARARLPLADLAQVMTRYPQVLVNVAATDKARAAHSPELAAEVAAAKAELGDSGRVLVRPSGTEPAVRIMVEAKDADHAERLAGRLAAAVRSTS
jgi:phosphoglucosamine mutase